MNGGAADVIDRTLTLSEARSNTAIVLSDKRVKLWVVAALVVERMDMKNAK